MVVGRFEPLAGADAAELELIAVRLVPAAAMGVQRLEYELLISVAVGQSSVGARGAGSQRPRVAVLLAERESSRVPGVVDLLSAVPRVVDGSPARSIGRSERVARVVPGEKPLTGRELMVLRALSSGLTNPEIAARLHISGPTVHSHVRKIFRKLGVHDRRDLIGIHAPDREK